MKFSEWVDVKNKLNVTKIGGATIGVSPQMGSPKFKLFTLLSYVHEIFKVSKHKGKITFDKI